MDVVVVRSDSRNKRRKKRVISFDPNDKIFRLQHHSDYTKEEYQGTWYSRTELSELRKKNLRTIRLMKKKKRGNNNNNKIENNDTEEHCSRGLEHKIFVDRSTERRAICKRAKAAVFEEQEVQDWNDTRNVDKIAIHYFAASQASAFQAYKMGLMDELHVFDPDYSLVQQRDRGMKEVQLYMQFSTTSFACEQVCIK